MSSFFTGLLLGLSLIMALGAQNAFVLRQGLRREHVGTIVLFCALADALLMAAGVAGPAQVLGGRPHFECAYAAGTPAIHVYHLWTWRLEALFCFDAEIVFSTRLKNAV